MTLNKDCSNRHDSSKSIAASGWDLISLFVCIENYKNRLIRNQWIDFISWQKCFFGNPLPRVSSCRDLWNNMVARGQGLFSLYIYIENFKNLLVIKNVTNFNIPWQECFLVTIYHDCSGSHDSSKIMAAWWWEVPISLYRKLHHRIVKNHWTNFNITGQKCFLCDLLPRLSKQSWFFKKWPLWGEWGCWFSLYIYKENFIRWSRC